MRERTVERIFGILLAGMLDAESDSDPAPQPKAFESGVFRLDEVSELRPARLESF